MTEEENLTEIIYHYSQVKRTTAEYVAKKIIQAGYKSPEEISQLALDYQLGVFDGRRLEKETMLANGYVKLAENQTLPECLVGNRPRAKAFRDMLNAGFRRIPL